MNKKIYIDEIVFIEPITDYLKQNLNKNIKSILDIVDALGIEEDKKRIIRKTVLDNFNEYFMISCKVMTKIQQEK